MPRIRTFAAVLALPLTACGGDARPSSDPANTLAGLYESEEGPRRDQLCISEREGGPSSFGLILWGRGDANCSASGTARREGDRLRLLPDGEESCAIDARVEGGRISLTNAAPAHCTLYYCGPGGDLSRATFERSGGDAAQARDLAGEPLCAG